MSTDINQPYVIISADTHAELPTEQYRPYIDPEFREEFDAFLAEKQALAEQGQTISDEAFAEQWFEEHGEGIAGGWDSDARDRELNADGVCGEVIFPDADAVTGVAGAPFGAGLGQSGDLDPRQAMAGARAHNRWLAELCAVSPDRRAGVAVIPAIFDIDAAVAETVRSYESGLRGGIMIPATWGSYRPYHDHWYDPLWATCQELGIPVQTHVGNAPASDFGEHLGLYIQEVRWWGARPMWFAIWSGVFERFPKLIWGATECSAFWVGDMLWLADTRFRRDHSAKKLSSALEGGLKMLPSEYFDRNCFVGATTTERRELEQRYEIGVDNLLWGNDYPHPEGTWPNTAEWLRSSFGDLPIEECRTMLGLAAAPIFGFDLDKMTALAAQIGPTPADLGQVDDAAAIAAAATLRAKGRHWLTNTDPITGGPERLSA